MSGTTISTTITTSLDLTSANQEPVLITDTGAIELGPLTISAARVSPNYIAIYDGSGTSATVTNFGTVFSYVIAEVETGYPRPAGGGISLDGGVVINGSNSDTSAFIQNVVFRDVGTIFNYATISPIRVYNPATYLSSEAILAFGDSTIVNGSDVDTLANIAGGFLGIEYDGPTDIFNFGTITGSNNAVFSMYAAGTLVNGSQLDTAALVRTGTGSAVEQVSSVINYGTIFGGGGGASVIYTSNLLNFGSIFGGEGVAFEEGFGGAVENAGLIKGSNGTAISQVRLLQVDPGGVFLGNVIGEGSQHGNIGTLELKAGATSGELDGIGTSFTGFVTIAIDTGAAWTLTGNATGLAAGQTITGFSSNDTVVLEGFTASSHSFVSGMGLKLNSNSGMETLNFLGIAQPNDFVVTDIAAGTEISICYVRGTRILTPTGEVPVEQLAIGDAVVTRFGGIQKIRWIGKQKFDWRFVKNNPDKIPVRIAPGALGEHMPARELAVSPGHSMLLGETLVLARDLVNGVTITQGFNPARDSGILEYYQIELKRHDCVAAEGCWAETYADAPGLRAQFHNAAEYASLYPNAMPRDELCLCADRPEHGPKLAAALLPVITRAWAGRTLGRLEGWVEQVTNWRVEGWAIDTAHPALPVILEIWLGKRFLGTTLARSLPRGDLVHAGKSTGRCAFSFTSPIRLAGAQQLRVLRASDAAELPHIIPRMEHRFA